MKKLHFVLGLLLVASAFSANAGLTNAIYWDFSNGGASPGSNPFNGLAVVDLSRGNNDNGPIALLNASVSGASSGYVTAAGFSASGETNAYASTTPDTFDANTSTFFETALSLDLPATSSLAVTNVSFGSRSTSSGPTTLSLYASTDGFSSDFESLGHVAVSANSTWSAVQFANLSLGINPGETLSLRLYGSDGTSTSTVGNWRIDDLGIAVTSVPEPSTIALGFVSGLAGWILFLGNLRKQNGT